MPIYEYQAVKPSSGCEHCADSFEVLQQLSEPKLTSCPECGCPLTKLISPPAIGSSIAGFDDRAKSAGFHKLKKLGKGEYEKQY